MTGTFGRDPRPDPERRRRQFYFQTRVAGSPDEERSWGPTCDHHNAHQDEEGTLHVITASGRRFSVPRGYWRPA